MENLLEIYKDFKKTLSSNGVMLNEILILEELIYLEELKEYGLTKNQLERMARMAWSGYLKYDGIVAEQYLAEAIVNYWLYEKEENGITFEEFVDTFDRWVFCEYLEEVL